MTLAVDESRKSQMPYVAFRTFKNFFERFDIVPDRVDRSLLRYTSGASGSQIMHALRALSLIDSDNRTTPAMERVAIALKGDDKTAFINVLRDSYPTLFEPEFRLDRVTPGQLREKFEEMGANGDTVRKCVAFFLAAADEAGIPYSQHIKANSGGAVRAIGTKSQKRAPRNGQSRTAAAQPPAPVLPERHAEGGQGLRRDLPPAIIGILGLLPGNGQAWPSDRRKQFVETFERVLDLCYQEPQK